MLFFKNIIGICKASTVLSLWLMILLFYSQAGRADCPCVTEEVLPDLMFPSVQIETSMGEFVIELNRMRAPITSNNFLRYVMDGHYDNTIFHRVMPNFVVQGGGYSRELEEKELRPAIYNESGNGLENLPMSVAMARYEDPHSATSQFYVNLSANESLDPNSRSWGYAVFGTVVSGQDVVEAISKVETGYSEGLDATDVPLQAVLLIKASVLE
jgi:peptidyl-prolyl cis-trans isomerase A (cyclophilin A)